MAGVGRMRLCSARLDSGHLESGPGSLCPTWARGPGVSAPPTWARGLVSLPPNLGSGPGSLCPTWTQGMGLWYTQQATTKDYREIPM